MALRCIGMDWVGPVAVVSRQVTGRDQRPKVLSKQMSIRFAVPLHAYMHVSQRPGGEEQTDKSGAGRSQWLASRLPRLLQQYVLLLLWHGLRNRGQPGAQRDVRGGYAAGEVTDELWRLIVSIAPPDKQSPTIKTAF